MVKTLVPNKSGKIELPQEVVDRMNSKPGMKMRIRDLPDGNFLIEIGYDPRDLRGIVKDRGIRLTIEEIGEVIKSKGDRI